MTRGTRYDKIDEWGPIIFLKDTESGEFVIAEGEVGDRQELYRSFNRNSAEQFFGEACSECMDE